MNNATLEHLLQISTPPREAGASATRPRGDAPPFDSLFRRASEPQAGTNPSADPLPSSPSPTPASRRSEAPAAPNGETTTTQESARNTDSEYVAGSAAAQDEHEEHEEPERDELESTEPAAVAAIAVKETVSAAEPESELAAAEDIEQAIADAVTEPTGDSKPKPNSKTTPVAESFAEISASTSDSNTTSPDEEPATNEVALVESTITIDEKAEAAPKDQVAAPAEAVTPAHHESKGKARAPSKAREATDAADSAEVAKPAADDTTDQPAATDVAKESTADGAPVPADAITEATGQDAAATPSSSRAESKNDEQLAASGANRDQIPAPVRPAAATSAVATNIQHPTQAANSTAKVSAGATVDASTKTDAGRTKDAALSPFARLERNQTGTSRGASGTGHSQSSQHVDPARFVSRVARAIHTAQERGAPLQLRLSPPELGAMRIELSVNQGNLTATIETDNTSARQVLLENLPALRERLAEQNVKIERFDVDVRRDGGGQQNPATQQQNDQPQQDRAATRGQSVRGSTIQTNGDEPAPVRRTITASTINVIA